MSLTDITPLTTVHVVTTLSSDWLPLITQLQPVLVLADGRRVATALRAFPVLSCI